MANEVERLCKAVGVNYDKNNLADTVVNMLDKSLNAMPNEDFKKLPYSVRIKLGSYGDALQQQRLEIASGDAPKLSVVIRDCVSQGVTSYADLKKQLDAKNLFFHDRSAKTIFAREKKRAGLGKSKDCGTMAHARKFFDNGRGAVTMGPMRIAMDEAGIEYKSTTLSSCLLRLRREHGLAGDKRKKPATC